MVRVFATVPAASLRTAIQAARVITDATAGATPVLKPVEIIQVGLMWTAARSVMGLADVDPLETSVHFLGQPLQPGK